MGLGFITSRIHFWTPSRWSLKRYWKFTWPQLQPCIGSAPMNPCIGTICQRLLQFVHWPLLKCLNFWPFWKELRLDRVATHRIRSSKHVKTERLTCPLPLATSLVRSYCPGWRVPTNVALVLYPHWQRLRQQKNWAIAWAGSFFMASFAEERVFGSCLHCIWRNLQESAHRVDRSSPDVAHFRKSIRKSQGLGTA